jgi:TolB-like protein/Tfp pilus assembly protein PilF
LFRLKLFGGASIEGPNGPVSGRAVQRRRIALLALLALARGRGLTREKLVGYLWPDSDPERARRLLSDSVYRINQAIGGEALLSIGDELRLDPKRLPSDAWEFSDAVEHGDWERAVALQPAPFLDGFYLTDSVELERWIDVQRDRLSGDRARALEGLAEAAEQAGQTRQAVRWWRALASHDPYNSGTALRLAQALERNGERVGALRHLRQHSSRLQEEIGVSPDSKLSAFAEALAAPAAGMEQTRTVAVLPFATLGTVSEDDYFAEGVTEDLIGHLARIGALSVISRASSKRFKDSSASHREIGAALGATNLVTGTVRRSGNRVRVTVQLVDTSTDRYAWAETYDRELTDVFEIQSDVALHIASALQTRLSADERSRIVRQPTRSVEAYQRYLQGRHWLVQFTGEGLRRSIEYFERALELDPGYALAYAGIAMAYSEMGETGLMDPNPAYEMGRKAAEAALALDDSLPEAHCVLAQLKAVFDFDYRGAEIEFERALELSPSSADTLDFYGRMCAALGRHDESVALQRRALELDPLAHRADYATALMRAGRHDEALAAAESAVEFDPQYARARATLGWALIKRGQNARGVEELEAAVALEPTSSAWLAQLGQAYALTGRTSDAHQVLDRLEARSRERYVSPYHMAYVWTGLGEHDQAIDALEVARQEHAGSVYGIRGSFLFEPLRAHPRFKELVRRLASR